VLYAICMSPYNFDQHRHNYSVWTAARAAQRGFTTTKNIKAAIDNSDLRTFAESDTALTADDFEIFHRKCCRQIIERLDKELPGKTTYGRAAKIIAIYLKTSVIIANKAVCSRSNIIHPPIDNILLSNLTAKVKLPAIRNKRWTLLSEEGYWQLVSTIRSALKSFNWTLEEYWNPEIDN
jgi:hypothetical protein